jgi:hypothetical protein
VLRHWLSQTIPSPSSLLSFPPYSIRSASAQPDPMSRCLAHRRGGEEPGAESAFDSHWRAPVTALGMPTVEHASMAWINTCIPLQISVEVLTVKGLVGDSTGPFSKEKVEAHSSRILQLSTKSALYNYNALVHPFIRPSTRANAGPLGWQSESVSRVA